MSPVKKPEPTQLPAPTPPDTHIETPVAPPSRTAMKVLDLSNSFENSNARIEELRAGRLESDIPLNDEYWRALRKHREAYQKGTLK